MTENAGWTVFGCVLVMSIATALSIFNLKEERVEKDYIKAGYQKVLINSHELWQKVPQTGAELIR
jgi:hypothetical protein